VSTFVFARKRDGPDVRIAIYALCKNEVKNVESWYQSCREADLIVVTDTGSTDGSLDELSRIPCQLHTLRVLPWRFDDAFNAALNHVPEDVDICIRLDFDERLRPGWREALESVWTPETTKLRYPYIWNWNADGTPDRLFYGDRIHARRSYRWSGATHEGLTCRGREILTWTDKVRIDQFPDTTKPRPNDLPLLEEAVRDTPNDTRLWGYLGREYWFKGDIERCVETYKKFLDMPSDTQERAQAFLILAKAEPDKAVEWLDRCARECREYREPHVDRAILEYGKQEWRACLDACLKAIAITERPQSYVCLTYPWGSLPHDLAAISAWNLGLLDLALDHVRIACELAPDDLRLRENLRYIEDAVSGQKARAA
jgi:tetratricopeptide (TPR) repeat protein